MLSFAPGPWFVNAPADLKELAVSVLAENNNNNNNNNWILTYFWSKGKETSILRPVKFSDEYTWGWHLQSDETVDLSERYFVIDSN